MATLQAARSGSTFGIKSHLKLATGKPMRANLLPKPGDAPVAALPMPEPAFAPAETPSAHPHHGLTDLQHRQLMLQVASIYPGWQLVSMQHRPENELLVAHLVRATDEPNVAIREGHSLQIIMDASGDLRIRHPRPKHESILARMLRWLVAGAKNYYSFASLV